jgi:hypothetical protein
MNVNKERESLRSCTSIEAIFSLREKNYHIIVINK